MKKKKKCCSDCSKKLRFDANQLGLFNKTQFENKKKSAKLIYCQSKKKENKIVAQKFICNSYLNFTKLDIQ